MNKFAFLSKFKQNFKLLFSNKKSTTILIVAIIICLILFFMPTFFKKNETQNQSINNVNFSVSEYSEKLENKLENLLLGLDEISSVKAMVMVESTPKIEYLTESEDVVQTDEKKSSSTKSTTVVFEKNGSISTPVVVTTIMPRVTGVLLVVDKLSASTKVAIINSISVVLKIDASCISILQES